MFSRKEITVLSALSLYVAWASNFNASSVIFAVVVIVFITSHAAVEENFEEEKRNES